MSSPGTLFLVPTPIGNLGDITERSIEVLRACDLIACEDTRTTGSLLVRYGISGEKSSFHAHNEHRKTAVLVDRLLRGADIALVTDAGTPGISDPGFLLVRECVRQSIRVVPLPGATALVPALAASGLPVDRFVFEGFLPPRKGRKSRLEMLSEEDRTIVLYESPHRIVRLLEQLEAVMGGSRPVVVARELTKMHEEFIRGSVSEVLAILKSREKIKGEIVLILAGRSYAERLESKGGTSR